ncbi:uncharacterized protein LOC132296458 [Cornus florida]|uniref:uncharacterized protein LOC132296458 n=1 Tax=Cornus florida TaxID=4283 RepID=UPI002897C923|nr:uncharacterized protein LOC132296458 [Cornus florida]
MNPSVKIFSRFTNIINPLKNLGRVYPSSDHVRKILWALPKNWNSTVTTIQEAKDIEKLPLDELFGSFLSYEITMKDQSAKEAIQLKTTTLQPTTNEEVSKDAIENDEEIALATLSYKKYLQKKKYNKRGILRKSPSSSSRDSSQKEQSTCFYSGKPGHFKAYCFLYKKEKEENSKKKSMKALWEDDDSLTFGSDDDLVTNNLANLCLMANDDEVNSSSDSSFEQDISFNDLLDEYNGLQEAFQGPHKDLGKMVLKCASLKRENFALSKNLKKAKNENESLQKEIESISIKGPSNLISENESLNLTIEDQLNIIFKFTQGKENLRMMLGNQQSAFFKNGPGYTPHSKDACLLK